MRLPVQLPVWFGVNFMCSTSFSPSAPGIRTSKPRLFCLKQLRDHGFCRHPIWPESISKLCDFLNNCQFGMESSVCVLGRFHSAHFVHLVCSVWNCHQSVPEYAVLPLRRVRVVCLSCRFRPRSRRAHIITVTRDFTHRYDRLACQVDLSQHVYHGAQGLNRTVTNTTTPMRTRS